MNAVHIMIGEMSLDLYRTGNIGFANHVAVRERAAVA
jgi:hypothetical protein